MQNSQRTSGCCHNANARSLRCCILSGHQVVAATRTRSRSLRCCILSGRRVVAVTRTRLGSTVTIVLSGGGRESQLSVGRRCPRRRRWRRQQCIDGGPRLVVVEGEDRLQAFIAVQELAMSTTTMATMASTKRALHLLVRDRPVSRGRASGRRTERHEDVLHLAHGALGRRPERQCWALRSRPKLQQLLLLLLARELKVRAVHWPWHFPPGRRAELPEL